MTSNKQRGLVLLSGGVDSTACVALLQPHIPGMVGLFVDYGQPAAQRERVAAREVANHYGLSLTEIVISGAREKRGGEILGRNALLITVALSEAPFPKGSIAMGIHAGTSYFDCEPPFVKQMQEIANGYAHGQLQLQMPFIHWTKRQILEFCQQAEVPLHLTYSCESSNTPCRHCNSCLELQTFHAR